MSPSKRPAVIEKVLVYPVSLKGSAQILSAQYGPDEGVSASHLTKPVKMDGSTVASRPNSSALNSTKDASATVTTSSADSGNGALGTMRQREVHRNGAISPIW
ncbi:hypothetical protein TYRP_012540 [Tyrophagus putrescentiae]|nr:hypothetical protein TYRP_012540 [Tyrophagus putrescentiae]